MYEQDPLLNAASEQIDRYRDALEDVNKQLREVEFKTHQLKKHKMSLDNAIKKAEGFILDQVGHMCRGSQSNG